MNRRRSAQARPTSPARRTPQHGAGTGHRGRVGGQPGQLDERGAHAGARVEHERVAGLGGSGDEVAEQGGDVVDVHEVASLVAVAVERDGRCSRSMARNAARTPVCGSCSACPGPVTAWGRTTVSGTRSPHSAVATDSASDLVSPRTDTGWCGSSSRDGAGRAAGQHGRPKVGRWSRHSWRPSP